MSHHKKPHTLGGLRLRALRESYGKTQLDVELDANLGIGYLQRLELGKVQQPEQTESDPIVMPKLVFNPMSHMTLSILNAEIFLSAQIRIMQYERQRCGDEAWYNVFLNEMRQYQFFEEYWVKEDRVKQGQVPMRPLAPLKFDTGKGIAQFLVISEPFVQDHRFRVIYYVPADAATTLQCLAWQEIA
jgi:hypothetical protein